MNQTELRIEAYQFLERVEKLLETLCLALAEEAKQISGIIATQLLSDLYRESVALLEGVQDAKQNLEDKIANDLGLVEELYEDEDEEE